MCEAESLGWPILVGLGWTLSPFWVSEGSAVVAVLVHVSGVSRLWID